MPPTRVAIIGAALDLGAGRRGVAGAELDGVPVDPRTMPLVDDGGTHVVQVVLGDAEQVAPGAARTGWVARHA